MVNTGRRSFIKQLSAGIALLTFPFKPFAKGLPSQINEFKFTLPALPFAYNALEPYIDEPTMRLHHGKHHQGYIDKLNTADWTGFTYSPQLGTLCKQINLNSSALIRNNMGGHYNHSLFWQLLSPQAMSTSFSKHIEMAFGSVEAFKTQFTEAALKHFGSGWCWLVVAENRSLKICTTPNQDNPLMEIAQTKGKPVLALDLWEHAYYLKYQNRRAEYIQNWFSVINWKTAEALFNGLEI